MSARADKAACWAQEAHTVTLFHDARICQLLFLNHVVSPQRNDSKLSEQRAALSQGQNPLPIYLTINVKDDVSNQDFRGNTAD